MPTSFSLRPLGEENRLGPLLLLLLLFGNQNCLVILIFSSTVAPAAAGAALPRANPNVSLPCDRKHYVTVTYVKIHAFGVVHTNKNSLIKKKRSQADMRLLNAVKTSMITHDM